MDIIFHHAGTAGLFGSDGCVRSDNVRFYQSCKNMCVGLSKDINEMNRGNMVSTASNVSLSPNAKTRGKFFVRIKKSEVGLMALRYGIFDAVRRAQWIVLITLDTIRRSDECDLTKDLIKMLDVVDQNKASLIKANKINLGVVIVAEFSHG